MKLADTIRDVAGLAGCALIASGAGSIYPPAGLIAAGLLLLGGAWLHAKRS